MRDGLRGLTLRGRCFLAAGAAAALCGLLLGEKDLLRIAVFLAVLPLLAAFVVSRTRYRLACARLLQPPRVQVGQHAEVQLRIDNLSRVPTGLMLLEDGLPYTLGGRPRFVLDRLGPRRHRSIGYPVRADLRGRYPIGPLSVRLADPFGLCELTRSFSSLDYLTVTPVVTPLPPVRLGGEWVGGGDSQARAVSSHGEDDIATREYRNGDDLRKVHWRSTARTGKLMVRREEQPWQSRAVIFLDTRASAHRGDGPGSSFEWAVSAAASVTVSLARHGYAMRLVTDAGADIAAPAGLLAEGALLDFLAEVQPSKADTLTPAIERLRHSAMEGLAVGILGLLAPGEAEMLARARTGSSTGLAVLLDANTWIGLSGKGRADSEARFDASARMLLQGGWRVLEAARGASIATLWSQAGSRPLPRSRVGA
jgi:uncharacterized protein (DUF58 family)